MKKTITIFTIIFSSVCSFALAEDQGVPQPDEQQSDMSMPVVQQDGGHGDRQGMMGGKKMGMMGPKGGMHPTIVATSDGGVVVLMGNRLVKYDSALNLVKEAEMKGGPKPPTASASAPGEDSASPQ